MVKIISDSTCDLSAELAAQYDIDILPLHILLGDEEFEDGKTITPDEIYSWSDEHKTTPKTSAPSLAETIELFRPYVEEGREIVCFSISNSMSTSGNVMRLAAGELEAENRIHRNRTSCDRSCHYGKKRTLCIRNCFCHGNFKTKCQSKLCRGYPHLPVPWRTL